MLGSALIVFREVLEAALIVAVVMGATRGVAGRGRWVLAGIALGVAGATVVAAFAGVISNAVEGRGQELLNAGILLAAVLMLAWHNVWMSVHGRRLAAQIKEVGRDVSVGTKPLSALALVTLLAVLREGSETVLFLYGLAASGADGLSLLGGGVAGICGGAALGWLLYRGLLAIPIGQFMTIVGWLVLLLAAGLAADAAGFFNQAGLIPALDPQVWDTSGILSQQSWLGMLLHILVGYNDRPMGIQLVFYVATLSVIYALMRTVGASAARRAGEHGSETC
ncbi:MAG: FTR1 family protein [Proteobacteria bacterium]|nr:FTR1 family protein [Pseudomonadota bacterium]